MDTAFIDDCLRQLVERLNDPKTTAKERIQVKKDIDGWLDTRNLIERNEACPTTTLLLPTSYSQ